MLALALLGLAGCAAPPRPALHDETLIGEPRPYEPPALELAPAPRLAPISQPKPVRHGSRDKKRIALTFDACATQGPSQFDVKVIRTLIDMQVPATLFLGGKWMEEHPDETMGSPATRSSRTRQPPAIFTRTCRARGDERVREELLRTQDILYALTGRVARLFRAPHGEARRAGDAHGLAGEQGLLSIQYDLASGDPDPNVTTKRLLEYVSDRARNGSIVVLHMNGRGLEDRRGAAAHRAAAAQEGLPAGDRQPAARPAAGTGRAAGRSGTELRGRRSRQRASSCARPSSPDRA
ncbi:MAG: polysaccharide deacetylase family protein [Comamonadaceae bacterium]|nr:polysaccharide deacetylase family protein [Comamonadaceae bacterium]